MIENLPEMTHLQFAIALRIPTGGLWAIDLMKYTGMEGPRFYQAMKRMVDKGWVKDSAKTVHGTRTGTWYTLTNHGQLMAQRSITFYTAGQR